MISQLKNSIAKMQTYVMAKTMPMAIDTSRIAMIFALTSLCVVSSAAMVKTQNTQPQMERQYQLAALAPASGSEMEVASLGQRQINSSIMNMRHYIVSKPQILLQMTTGEVAQILGNPDFTRSDHTARIWQYQKGACVLDVYFYQDQDQNQISHYEVRTQYDPFTKPTEYLTNHECLTELMDKSDTIITAENIT